MDQIEDAVAGRKEIDADALDELEYALITADIGVNTTTEILESIRQRADRKQLADAGEIKQLIAQHLLEILEAAERPLPHVAEPPAVVMVVGVNGAGKTTTIGKLASRYKSEGRSVLLCAADTFRAAAIEQLQVWGTRTGDRRDQTIARRRPQRGGLRRAASRQSAQSGLRDRRHRRPPAHQNQSDGGAGKNAPHRRAR